MKVSVERATVDSIIKLLLKLLFSALFVLIVVSIFLVEATKKSPKEIEEILAKQREAIERIAQGLPPNPNLPDPWPPKMNEPYPSLPLIDQTGQALNINNLRGKVIILSFLDMSLPASQGQSGAGLSGPYGLTQEQDSFAVPFAESVRKALDDSFMLPHKDVLEINVLVYAQDGEQASVDDAHGWATHFDLKKEDNIIVAVPEKDIRGDESERLINRFQLIDKNNILRADSSGPEPKHNLTMTLIPLVPKLLR